MLTLGWSLNPFAKDDAALPAGTPTVFELYTIISHDPDYPRVAALVKELQGRGGIQLKRVVKPLQAYVWTRKHPRLATAAIAGGVFTLPLLGFLIGRITRHTVSHTVRHTVRSK